MKHIRSSFLYSSNDVLYEMTASSAGYPTAEGLQVGDRVDKMESIYGSGHTKDVEGYSVFQDYNRNHGLDLDCFYRGNTITAIRFHTDSSINND